MTIPETAVCGNCGAIVPTKPTPVLKSTDNEGGYTLDHDCPMLQRLTRRIATVIRDTP